MKLVQLQKKRASSGRHKKPSVIARNKKQVLPDCLRIRKGKWELSLWISSLSMFFLSFLPPCTRSLSLTKFACEVTPASPGHFLTQNLYILENETLATAPTILSLQGEVMRLDHLTSGFLQLWPRALGKEALPEDLQRSHTNH